MVLSLLAACTGASPTDTGGEPEGHFVAGWLAVANSLGDSDVATDTDTDEPVPIDADLDGYYALESGGDDCDDTNENVHPDAEDWCTETDENCDGVAIDSGRCSDTQAFLSRATQLSEEEYFTMLPVRDLTGDGLDDILVGTNAGATGVSPGDGTWAGFATWPLTAEWDVPYGCTWDEVRLDVGDIDGDGFNDVPIPSAGCGGGYDIAWGPFDGTDPTPPLTRWEGPEPQLFLSEQRWADLDGDSHPDLIESTALDDTDETWVFFGGQREAQTTTIESDYSARIARDNLGDIDGDGLDDIVFSDYYGSVWVSGANVARGATLERTDIQSGTLERMDDVEMDGASFPEFVPVGDWSGDGTADVIFVNSEADRGSLLYYDDFGPAEVSPSGRVDNDDVVEDHLGVYPGLLRHDGDPKMLFLSNNSYSEPEQYILLPDDWHTGTANLSEVRHLVLDNVTGEYYGTAVGYSWGSGDIDADGWSDVVVMSSTYPWYLSSFDDIPWNEPQYW